MPKFRKRQDVIEAMQVSELHRLAANDWWSLPDWMLAEYDKGHVRFLNNPIRVELRVLGGWTVTGWADDWIIFQHGGLYPCKSDLFEKTYEPQGSS